VTRHVARIASATFSIELHVPMILAPVS